MTAADEGSGTGDGAGGSARPDGSLGVQGEVGLRVGRRLGPATKLAITLGFLTVLGLMVLAAAGFYPAFYVLVVAVVGALLVIIGARLH